MAHKLPKTLRQCAKPPILLGCNQTDLHLPGWMQSLKIVPTQPTLTTLMIIATVPVRGATHTVVPAIVIKATATIMTALLKTNEPSALNRPKTTVTLLASMFFCMA